MTNRFYHQLYRILTVAALASALCLPVYANKVHGPGSSIVTAAAHGKPFSRRPSVAHFSSSVQCPYKVQLFGEINVQGLSEVTYSFHKRIKDSRGRIIMTENTVRKTVPVTAGRRIMRVTDYLVMRTARTYRHRAYVHERYEGWLEGDAYLKVYLGNRVIKSSKSVYILVWCAQPRITGITYPAGRTCLRRGDTFRVTGSHLNTFRFRMTYGEIIRFSGVPRRSRRVAFSTNGLSPDSINLRYRGVFTGGSPAYQDPDIQRTEAYRIVFRGSVRRDDPGVGTWSQNTYPLVYKPGVNICGPARVRSRTLPRRMQRR